MVFMNSATLDHYPVNSYPHPTHEILLTKKYILIRFYFSADKIISGDRSFSKFGGTKRGAPFYVHPFPPALSVTVYKKWRPLI